MNRIFFRTLFVLLLCVEVNAQNEQLKIQEAELKKATTDTVKIAILDKMGWQVIETDPKRAQPYIEEAHRIARSIHNDRWIVNTYIGLSRIQHNLGNFSAAQKINFETLKIVETMKSKFLTAACYGNISSLYTEMGNFSLAMEYGLKALKIYEELKDVRSMAYLRTNFGDFYYRQKEYDQAAANHLKAYELFVTLKDSSFISMALNNLSSVLYEQKKYKEALRYSLLSLKIKEAISDSIGIANCYQNIGDSYFALKDYSLALKYDTSALRIFTRAGNKYFTSLSCNNLSNIYLSLKDLPKALFYANEGFKIAKEIAAYDLITFSYERFSELYEAKKEYQKAMEFTKLKMVLNDSLFNAEKNKQLVEMRTRYETDNKEKEIEQLSQQNQIQKLELKNNWYLIVGLIGFAVLIMVISILISNRNKLRNNAQKMEVEQKLFRSQMNPHFIFNSLIAIQNYVYKHQPAEVAGYISSFAKLMRMILDNSRNEYVTVEKELKTLTYYLELQQLRFQDKFDFKINVDPLIETESISIPPMLSQPFIENAIEHGIMNKANGKGMIELEFNQKTDALEMIITDNGVGMAQAQNAKAGKTNEHASLATIITRERMAVLNKKNKRKFSLEIEDVKNNDGSSGGTRVRIMIPES
jgi:tetratricopeptide (TPR) repeat protein